MKMDRKIFFDNVRVAPFKGAMNVTQVVGMNAILDVFERDYNWPDIRWLAYCLATTFHETATEMKPVVEYGSQAYLRSKSYYPYIGRGYVQLTWERNYRDMGKKIGVDLMGVNMDKALDPEIAAKVMFVGMRDGDFTGKKLGDYFGANVNDARNARRIINGTDRAELVASYHELFMHAIEAASASTPQKSEVDEKIWVRRSEVAAALREIADRIQVA